MNEVTKTSVRHLRVNDVLAGSGFVVTRRPYVQVRSPKGKVYVEGRYPNQERATVHIWNPSTTVHVVS